MNFDQQRRFYLGKLQQIENVKLQEPEGFRRRELLLSLLIALLGGAEASESDKETTTIARVTTSGIRLTTSGTDSTTGAFLITSGTRTIRSVETIRRAEVVVCVSLDFGRNALLFVNPSRRLACLKGNFCCTKDEPPPFPFQSTNKCLSASSDSVSVITVNTTLL